MKIVHMYDFDSTFDKGPYRNLFRLVWIRRILHMFKRRHQNPKWRFQNEIIQLRLNDSWEYAKGAKILSISFVLPHRRRLTHNTFGNVKCTSFYIVIQTFTTFTIWYLISYRTVLKALGICMTVRMFSWSTGFWISCSALSWKACETGDLRKPYMWMPIFSKIRYGIVFHS